MLGLCNPFRVGYQASVTQGGAGPFGAALTLGFGLKPRCGLNPILGRPLSFGAALTLGYALQRASASSLRA